jgi:tRNA A-37 threonylcarbamoyl transferase component Bud32
MREPETKILPPRYRRPHQIGRGGMGEIYRAEDTVLGRTVVIKLLAPHRAENEEVRARFTREARAAARLSGEPNTVTIFDVGEWEGRPFIVMEDLPGGSLEERLREGGARRPQEALAVLEQTARALDAAHRHGVVHRDVKPANLLLDRGGEVHVADFGIASAAGLDSLTQTGTVLGTVGYLAPEQARGEKSTPATDCYALAVVAFELLTGTRPFEADSPTAEAAAHAYAEVPSASERRPDLPPQVDGVFRRALAKEPSERYPSCSDFVADLRQALTAGAGTTVVARPPAPARRSRPAAPKPRRSRSWPIAVAVLLALGLGGAALAALLAAGDDPKSASPSTVVTTITAPGTTSEVTVTTTAESPTSSAPSEPAEASPVALTDQATGLMRRGRWAEALPVALQAYSLLEGSGQRYEAYAAYDVGRSLVELGRCEEALPYLDRSQQIQGRRSEIDAARAACERGKAGGKKKKRKDRN